VRGGRCEACQGDGLIKVEMHFLPDVYVPCDVCQGKRYNRETLEILYKGHSIRDVLEMTVEDALELFAPVPSIARKLETLMDVGLSYIKLGQSATTLSGGEAQRVKLSKELSKRDTGRTLYILDEPTTGLHFHDIEHLLGVLHRLRDDGNTGGRDRAQPGRDQDRGLGGRPGAGRRPSRRDPRMGTPGRWLRTPPRTPAVSLRPCWTKPRHPRPRRAGKRRPRHERRRRRPRLPRLRWSETRSTTSTTRAT
jgi:hypothetical protein